MGGISVEKVREAAEIHLVMGAFLIRRFILILVHPLPPPSPPPSPLPRHGGMVNIS